MDEYKPNSHKAKEEPTSTQPTAKRVDGVIVGSASRKKRSDIKKFADVFIQEDVGNVRSYILLEVLVPAVKKALSDIVKDGVDMILYGETNRARKNGNPSRINYRGYYERDSDRRDRPSSRSREPLDYDEIVLDSRGDAEAVLDAMNDIISQYGIVSVSDLYDLANLDHPPYTMNKYGWTNITGAKAVRVRDGYALKLPRAIPID